MSKTKDHVEKSEDPIETLLHLGKDINLLIVSTLLVGDVGEILKKLS